MLNSRQRSCDRATLFAGFTRWPSALFISVAAATYEATGVPLASSLAACAAGTAWAFTDARVLNGQANRLPHTLHATSRIFKKNSDVADKVLPGLQPSQCRESIRTRLARGASVNGPGIISYVTAANLQNQSRQERRRLCHNLAIDNGLFWGTLALGSTGLAAVSQLSTFTRPAGEIILSHAGDPSFTIKAIWAAAALRVGGLLMNKYAKPSIEKHLAFGALATQLAARQSKRRLQAILAAAS